jgi:hypothetical protein
MLALEAGLRVQSSPTHGHPYVNNSEKDSGGPHLDTLVRSFRFLLKCLPPVFEVFELPDLHV